MKVFVEQPLALPGSAKNKINIAEDNKLINYSETVIILRIRNLNMCHIEKLPHIHINIGKPFKLKTYYSAS